LVNLSLGASNLVVGVLFTGLHLAIYQYLYRNWSMHFPWSHLGLQLLWAFVLYDFFYYWSHWAHHRCNMLWANHLVHHSGRHFNLSTAVRLGFFGAFTVWIFFLPMAMLGVSPEHYLLVIAAQFVYQFFIHTTLVRELGWLERVFVTPSQHRVHHANNPRYLDKNFGCFLVIWDRLFGSYQRELTEDPPRYGVTHAIARPESPGYLNCFFYIACLRQAWQQRGVLAMLKVLLGPPTLLHSESVSVKDEMKGSCLLSICARLLGPLLVSLYVVLNAAELSPVDAWRVPLAHLLASGLLSTCDAKPRKRPTVSLLATALEIGLILYLHSHYARLQPLLWLAMVGCAAAPAVDFIYSHFARTTSHD
jgi:sterol desaturase/sphingolipid hydroxylase (fatty acid hydroxylase superfamily)